MSKRTLTFAIISLLSVGFLYFSGQYFFAMVLFLTDLTLLLALIQTGNLAVEKNDFRPSLHGLVFVSVVALLLIFFEKDLHWRGAYISTEAQRFQLAAGGEWLLLVAFSAVLVAAIGSLVVRRAK